MKKNVTIIKSWLEKLCFKLKNGATEEVYSKSYDDDGEILVNVNQEKIDYSKNKKIKVESAHSTYLFYTNLNNECEPKRESLVVLECVDRLLKTGRDLKSITIEKNIKTEKNQPNARADIFVTLTNESGERSYIIECKTYGDEFEKEFGQMKEQNGGKAHQKYNKNMGYKASMIILYASSEAKEGNKFDYEARIFKVDKDNNATYDDTITFEDLINPSKNETTDKLTELDEEKCNSFFDKFMKLLRFHSISDQSNAFNKLITLILCKAEMEREKTNNTKAKCRFELKNTADTKHQLDHLIELYKNGMDHFVEKKVEYSFEGSSSAHVFSFKEVYNDETFTKNAEVVGEVVKLLKGYQFLYDRDHEPLSYLFEKLLTTGLKQNSGQFFTPIIIVRFILKSLPIKDLLRKKTQSYKSHDDLVPKIIDFAAGSGHFLIESIREIKQMVKQLNEEKAYADFGGDCQGFIDKILKNTDEWESKCIFGIEKDDRLAKIAKIGCALMRNRKVKLINSDGLAYFKHADVKDVLEEGKFEIVVSNPPFSVDDFSQDNKYFDKETFTLPLTAKSDDIECVFVERTKQLLKEDGIAGIILPRSILNTTASNIYIKTREIILKYFKIIAIIELKEGGGIYGYRCSYHYSFS